MQLQYQIVNELIVGILIADHHSVNTPQRQFDQILIENMGTAMMLLDEDLCLQYLNPAAEMLLEKSLTRYQGKTIHEICPSQKEMFAFLQKAQSHPQPMIKHGIPLRLPSGHHFTATLTSTPVESDNDRFILLEIIRINSDLSPEHGETQQQQYLAARALIRGLAHEIKNPLGGLRGAAQLLDAELESVEQKEYTQIIIAEADRLKLLIDRLLSPSSKPNKQLCNLHEVIEHVRKLTSADIHPNISVVTDYDPSIPELLMDRDQMVQVILNIFNNAVESLAGQGMIQLRTRVERQQMINGQRYPLSARICISDDGPGIPEELLRQIFFPMISGKASGTGLGLSIAQSLVTGHGGVITAHSRPGETNFEILLPITGST